MRPTLYSEDLAVKICELLAGGSSLISICNEAGMPHISTVLRWLPKYPSFRDDYARARETWAEAEFENMMRIADDGENDTYVDADGITRTDHDVISRSRLRVDTRKWALARMSPKKYGDTIKQEISNPDGSLSAMTPEQKAAKLEAIRLKAEQRFNNQLPEDGSDLV